MGLCEHSLGRHAYFSAKGKIAPMVLKAYTALSDSALMAQLNSNIHYQLFCGIRINPLNPLTHYKIVSDIRCELGRTLVIDRLQQVLASHWKPYLEHVSVLMTDATCYESSMRYPTDVKLLWASVSWIYHQLHVVVKRLKGRMPRSKYAKHRKRYYAYSRHQRETRVLQRSLLHLLNTLTGALEDTVVQTRGIWGKVNMLQVDGINFIEHFSFSAFNEGLRIPQCIAGQQALFRKSVTHLAADRIYATNFNRTYCSSRHITTSFIRKGRAGKDEAQAIIMGHLQNHVFRIQCKLKEHTFVS